MAGCLDGIRVLDLARHQAGPRCGFHLAQMGAEVIKIEKPGGEESRENGPTYKGQSVYWAQYNSGKKSVTLNLRTEKAKEVLRELVKISDVFLQNFRPGVIARMGFGYDELKKLKPDIIMTNVSGFGQYGPYRDRPAFDPIGQAMCGLMSLTGFPETPPTRTSFSIVDRVTALHATIGTLGALFRRQMTGEGQTVDVCLLDGAYTLTEIPISNFLLTGRVPKRHGNRSGTPPSNTYKARDGYVYITGSTRRIWSRFCEAIGHPEFSEKYGAQDVRAAAVEEIEAAINEWLKDKTQAEVVQIMAEAEVPCGPVNDIPAAARDPHLHEREMMVKIEDKVTGEMWVPGLTIKFSETPGKLGPIPAPGEHNEEILGKYLGITAEEIAGYRVQGIM
ncbi:MAG: CoA transferase [Bacteroidetes bacterium]|nr:CoA transferase [Bacteroidota bacterium]MCL5025705.1 CoA transferase [Chloroflexota bacterium]